MGKAECAVDACHRSVHGRGLCCKHYERAKADGSLSQYKAKKVHAGASLDERLRHAGWELRDHDWAQVETPCWEWRGGVNAHGYGTMAVGNHRDGNSKRSVPMLAHRAAYTAWVDAIPDGKLIRHRCDNPPCINPDHLLPGTDLENSTDSVSRHRTATGERKATHKLTDVEIASIRQRYASGGVTQRALAADFGVCQQLISGITRMTRRAKPTRTVGLDDRGRENLDTHSSHVLATYFGAAG